MQDIYIENVRVVSLMDSLIEIEGIGKSRGLKITGTTVVFDQYIGASLM